MRSLYGLYGLVAAGLPSVHACFCVLNVCRWQEPLYPMIGMSQPGEAAEVNFGEREFVFNVAAMREVSFFFFWRWRALAWLCFRVPRSAGCLCSGIMG